MHRERPPEDNETDFLGAAAEQIAGVLDSFDQMLSQAGLDFAASGEERGGGSISKKPAINFRVLSFVSPLQKQKGGTPEKPADRTKTFKAFRGGEGGGGGGYLLFA